MLLFNSLVFGAFVGFLVDYWLSRATVKDPARLIIAVAVAVVVAVLVNTRNLGVF